MAKEQLAGFRQQIDAIDDQILELLNTRAALAIQVGRVKRENKMDFYVPSREQAIFDRLEKRNRGPFPTDAISRVYREIISASISLESVIKVVYLGPRATFTHIAALQRFGQSAHLISAKTISSVFEEVEFGRAGFGVVPIENSNEGAVTHTLDMFMRSNLKITQEHYLEVSHDLLGKEQELHKIERIYSHPQAIEQCRRWLEDNCGQAKFIEVSSTARAAQMVTEEEGAAAIANRHAAKLYGLQVLAGRIENNHHNYTRFLVIGNEFPPPTKNDKTSLMFSFMDQPGILARMLEPFRSRGLNLMKIESRPVKKKAWEYVFFLDIEGHYENEDIRLAIDELSGMTQVLKVLGSYPRAR